MYPICGEMEHTKLPDFIGFPKIIRYENETCILTEKIDGTNGCLYVTDDSELLAGSRSGWLNENKDNFGFYKWAMFHRNDLIDILGKGYHFGEWYGRGINRNYNKKYRHFALFSGNKYEGNNILFEDGTSIHRVPFLDRCNLKYLQTALDQHMKQLMKMGSKLSDEFIQPEGIMIYLVGSKKYIKYKFDTNQLEGI